jgi:hypothetical protein
VRTIWLASYPKSGNTWLRLLIANLSACGAEPVDINDLPERGGIASARGPFDYLLLIDSGLLSHDEVDCLRPLVYQELARGAPDDEYDEAGVLPPTRFVKVHDAYTRTQRDEPLLGGARAADGAIVIVRDPRDIAPSLANHNRSSTDEAVAFLNNPRAAFCGRATRQDSQLRQRLPGWGGHVASWLDQSDIPVHVVRYEDMIADTSGTLVEALAFAGMAASAEDVRRAVAMADFDSLQQQESSKGFREASRRGGRFFRRGQAGAWRDELTKDQISLIEAHHGTMMTRLGYLFSDTGTGRETV